jgi:23S rRNA pseudouridine1911/1915/1917 synthase
MSSIGHPVFCDEVYGGLHTKTEQINASKINGQCLHARTLGFIHPTSGEEMRFESELPEYFSTLLTKLTLK